MTLFILKDRFCVCQLFNAADADLSAPFTFLSVTDREISLVCPEGHVPGEYAAREDGWRALRIEGVLDFSLTGILAGIANILAENKIPIFAVSTYDTDYVLIKEEFFERALQALKKAGYRIR